MKHYFSHQCELRLQTPDFPDAEAYSMTIVVAAKVAAFNGGGATSKGREGRGRKW